ncbi:MAG: hypothetical protein M3076_10615 [Actinomycetota bacterium]|nr:hypothetical protein [Actinomycetota bacterium]
MGLTSQVHDFNPGIRDSGLFWTTPIERGSLRVNLGSGSASLHLANEDIEDYHDVVNALQDGPSKPATVSLDISWEGARERVNLRNPRVHFAGEYVRNTATLVWSASEEGFRWRANPLTSGFAQIGHERNGIFFR